CTALRGCRPAYHTTLDNAALHNALRAFKPIAAAAQALHDALATQRTRVVPINRGKARRYAQRWDVSRSRRRTPKNALTSTTKSANSCRFCAIWAYWNFSAPVPTVYLELAPSNEDLHRSDCLCHLQH